VVVMDRKELPLEEGSMFVIVAIHYPSPGCKEQVFAYMKRIVAAMEGTPGMISMEPLASISEERLVTISRWQDESAFRDSLSTMYAVDGRDDSWFARPNEVLRLTP
jgi:quinol monooxygenase YgiN